MYDLIIKSGQIIDGTGASSYEADIAIKDGKIVKIFKNISDEGKIIIDAKGLTVTPGFIDSHSHSDNAILDYPDMIEKIEQGITSSVSGQCGSSIAPSCIKEEYDKYIDGAGSLSDVLKTFGSFASLSENIALGSNNACFVGHGNIRRCVMGMSQEKPEDCELEKMKELLRDAMENGAMGLSLGLIYPPSSYADTSELIELAKTVKEYNGIVSAHIRNEGDKLIEATEEFIDIIRKSGVKGVLSHHKACGSYKNWGKVNKTLKLIDEAICEGLDIYLDVYPYIATHTSASVTFVPDSGRDLLKRLESSEERKKMREYIKTKWWGDDYSWVQVVKCEAYPEYEGKYLDEIAKLHGKDGYETILDMIYESKNDCKCCYFTMCEDDVKTVLGHKRAMICTDASVSKGKNTFHPRLKGTFPRVLGKYVREENVVSLTEMIRKMTSLPASVYELKGKGILKEGMDADICVFDFEKIIDHSAFNDCVRRAEGLEFVILGGEIVVKDAVYNGKRKGKVILKGEA